MNVGRVQKCWEKQKIAVKHFNSTKRRDFGRNDVIRRILEKWGNYDKVVKMTKLW